MTGNAYVDAAIEALKQVTEDEGNEIGHILVCNIDDKVILSFNNDHRGLVKMMACALYKSKDFRVATELALNLIHRTDRQKKKDGDFISEFTETLERFSTELDVLGKKYNIKPDKEE